MVRPRFVVKMKPETAVLIIMSELSVDSPNATLVDVAGRTSTAAFGGNLPGHPRRRRPHPRRRRARHPRPPPAPPTQAAAVPQLPP